MTKYFLAFIAMLLIASSAQAQFSISTRDSGLQGTGVIDTVDYITTLNNPYFSQAKWEAEKLALRKERNTTEIAGTLQLSQTSFDNWESGGSNTFNARSTFSFSHVYKKEIMTVTSTASARYGLNIIDGVSFKNEDEFKLGWKMAWQMSGWWSYGGAFNFRSQFDKGYEAIDDNTLVSSFLSPAYTDVSLGFSYQRDESPFSMTLSPLTGSVVIVMDDSLSMAEVGGVEAGKHTKGEIGPSIRLEFDKKFGKEETFRYQSELYSFTNLKNAPTVRWENTVDFAVSKYLTTTLYLLAYYDKSAATPKPEAMQYQYSLSIGLSYTFKNK